MKPTIYVSLLIAFLGLVLCSTGHAADVKKDLKANKQWNCSIADEKLKGDAQECITSKKQFEKLWKSWSFAEKLPEVNFEKELVVVITGDGSKLSLTGLKLDDKGNLEVIGIGTLDLGQGFRYVVATVNKEGIKKVNGKDLPKE